MLRLIDLQNGGYKGNGQTFKNRKEIREALLSFHAPDLEKPMTRLTCDDLLEIGGWEIEKV